MSETPLFTKLYLFSTVSLSLLVFSTALDPYSITYSFKTTFMELSLYRPLTALLYLGRVGMLLPLHLPFAYLATSRVGTLVHPPHRPYDLVWLTLLLTGCLMIFSTLVANLYFYGSAFVMALLTIWALQHPTDRVSLAAFQLNSVYFPLLYAVLMVALGSNFRNYVAGVAIGLAYGMVKNPAFVREHGDTLPTPNWLKKYFRPGEEPQREPQHDVQRGGEYFRGVGVRLG